MKIIGKGSIMFNGENGIVELTDVLLCEELASNLLSGFDIQNKGVTVKHGCQIELEKDGKRIFTGKILIKAWILELEILKKHGRKTVCELPSGNMEHTRLGHVAKLEGEEECVVCLEAKATAKRKKKNL